MLRRQNGGPKMETRFGPRWLILAIFFAHFTMVADGKELPEGRTAIVAAHHSVFRLLSRSVPPPSVVSLFWSPVWFQIFSLFSSISATSGAPIWAPFGHPNHHCTPSFLGCRVWDPGAAGAHFFCHIFFAISRWYAARIGQDLDAGFCGISRPVSTFLT